VALVSTCLSSIQKRQEIELMLTGSTSNTSRHSETRQSQAGRSPGLARHLLGLPQHIASKIWSFIPSEKAALARDLFEKRSPETEKSSPEKKELDRDLQLWLLNRSILPEEREGFLLKALTQPNVDNAQSDFSSILRPVFTERHPAPYLPRLLELAAYGNKSIAFERVIKTALENHTPLPESTYEWVAECGKPEMLNELLVKIQPALSMERKEELKKLAKAQEETIQRYSEFTLPQRQQKLRTAAQGIMRQRTAIENRRDFLALLQTPDIDVNSTYEWVAECGKPEMLNTLLRETRHALSKDRQQELEELAKAQEETIQRYNQLELPERQQKLRTAAQGLRQRTDIENKRDVLALLQTPDIDVSAADRFGDTALHLAAQYGRTETVNELLQAPGINVNAAANRLGYTPLHLALAGGHTEIVNALLGAPGVDVSAADHYGDTALHLAALNGRTETVNALLQCPGINVNAANQLGSTPLHLAVAGGHTQTVPALLQAPNMNVNAVDDKQYTPLHLAAARGHTETVHALLQVPNIDVNKADNDAHTPPLHLAAENGHTETVNALLQAPGINVNTVDDDSSTALHLAAADGHTETVNALLGAPGININAPNDGGVTPLQLAAQRGHAEIANALLQAGGI
jgi:ankyrin repeat protein